MTPTSRFWLILLVVSAPMFAAPFVGLPVEVAVIPTLLGLALGLADRVGGARTPIEVKRRTGPVLSVGVANTVALQLRNLSGRSLSVRVADEYPDAGRAEPEGAVIQTVLLPYKTAEVAYAFHPSRRGLHDFTGLQVAHPSRLGLWNIKRRFAEQTRVQVFPNIEALRRFELLARVNNLQELGVRSVRMRGEGTEFERLRDYRQGDEPRKVDWKATRRFGKLIVREMGQERNQNMLLMIDMGRMMRQTTEGLSHFDYALNTAIILGHIAQGRGDNVGAVFFSDQVKRYVPLGRGRATVEAIVHAGYDLEPESVSTDYNRMFRHVAAHLRKRSLLVLMTHLVPGEDRLLIRSFMTMLGRQHLPLCLFFREPALEANMMTIPAHAGEAFERAAAADILLERQEGLHTLRHAGVFAVDALPGELSAVAIGQYLDIKARNLL